MLMLPMRSHSALRALMATILMASVAAGCSNDDDASDTTADDGPILTGPLCDLLPQGSDPGGPELLVDETADVALTWIPVLTNFEAAVRATGLDDDLAEIEAVTILAPTDDAYKEEFPQDTIDDLLLFRQDELRALLESHLIEGSFSLAELLEAGSVTTLAGDTLTITGTSGAAAFDDRGETACADYLVANGNIHVIDGVLGDLPELTPIGDLGTG